MIYKKDSYVAGNMCDSKLKLSVLAADGIVENAITELMGDEVAPRRQYIVENAKFVKNLDI